MIVLDGMGHGAQLLGVAVLAPAEAQRLVALLASVDAAAAYAGVSHRVLLAPAGTPAAEVQRDGWVVLPLPREDLAVWKDIAARHSGHCAWLALWSSPRLMPRDWLLGKLSMADQDAQDNDLRRVAEPEPSKGHQWETDQEPPGLLGVTIITPGYEEVGEEAVRRFQRFTGLPVTALRFGGKSGHGYKLQLPVLVSCRVPVVFFDADLWLLRPTDFSPHVVPGGIAAVPDPGTSDPEGFVAHDIAALGLKAGEYFNSGLFIADLSSAEVREAMMHAAQAFASRQAGGVKDYGEQSFLNAAVQRAGLPFRAMPAGFNFFMHAVQHGYGLFPNLVHGLHGAGIRLDEKCRRMEEQAVVFGYRTPARLVVAEPDKPAMSAAALGASPDLPEDATITNVHKANNDGRFSLELRTARALRWIRERKALANFLGIEGVASCKCFLTYRAFEGLVAWDVWRAEVAPVQHGLPDDHPLWVRWEISQRTAEFYLHLGRGDVAAAELKGLRLISDVWRHQWLAKWQPMMANVLRVMSLMAYLHYLRGEVERAAELVEESVRGWTETMGAVDWRRWPRRWIEMRDDGHALMNCMFIGRACGTVIFEDTVWAAQGRANRKTRGEHPYMRLMREMGDVCEARRLWEAEK